jgi:hypothetical protein
MVLVLAKHGCGMPLVGDEDAVEELASDAADEAFGDRVGPRCPHWCLDDADVDGGEHGVDGGGELGVAVSDEEPEAPAGVVEVPEQVAGCWVSQAPVGWVVTPGMGTRRVVCSMTKETYSRGRVMVSRWNRSQATMPCACPRRNSAHEGPARRGEGSMPALCRIFQTVEAPIR